jgi:hypothetical protein
MLGFFSLFFLETFFYWLFAAGKAGKKDHDERQEPSIPVSFIVDSLGAIR